MSREDSISRYWSGIPVPGGAGEVLTKPTHVRSSDGVIRVGVDSSACKHLLVPCGVGTIVQDRRSRGVALVQQNLVVEGAETRFADLVCIEATLETAFLELVDDIARRIQERSADAVEVLHSTLREWRDLLRYAGSRVDRSSVIGLRGELEVLRWIASRDAANAVAAWRGPRGEPFDFMRGAAIAEVKTTVSQDGHTVQIHGLQQLDPPDDSELSVAFVRLRPDDLGESIPAVIDDLYSLGVDREEMDRCLESVGYRHDLSDSWAEAFKVVEMRVWHIDEHFPGLRSARILPRALSGLSEISYAIDLDAGGPPLDPESQAEFLSRLSEST
jgi:hypothetical protein